jgi:NAD+ synthase (glutamine-hydrolysing)
MTEAAEPPRTPPGEREAPATLLVAGAQVHNRVGDLDGNATQVRDAMSWAEEQGADVLVLPEMCLTGYPISDLAFRRQFVAEARAALEDLARRSGRVATLVGCPDRVDPQQTWDTRERQVAIGQALLWGGELRGIYHKCLLPTYDVFDEARTFAAGRRPDALWRIGHATVGICICEDLWPGDGPPEAQAAAGAQVLLVPNGSPFYRDKPELRRRLVASVARRTGLPIVYVNCVGGQDDLVFDGGSFVVGSEGEELFAARQFRSDRFLVEVPLAPAVEGPATTVHARRDRRPHAVPTATAEPMDPREQVWSAICIGLRDFVGTNGFDGVAIALSGGVDSTVCLLAAVDALGPERVLAVAMPAGEHHAAEHEDARQLAEESAVQLLVHDLDELLELASRHLTTADLQAGHVRMELEARARSMLLASVAAERRLLPLATINKTELAIGASSVFGEPTGSFAPLRDCPKGLVYELLYWHDERHGLIPERVLAREASLRQRSGADLPPYEVLDPIVERYLSGEDELSELLDAGFDPEVVRGVLQLVDDAEFKRRLAPIGVKLTARAFGQDLRMPVSSRWRPYQPEERALIADTVGGELFEAGQGLAG